MIERYTRSNMGHIWALENKYRKWLEVELAVVRAMAELGMIPRSAATEIALKAAFDVKRIDEIEQVTKHDVIAFTTNLAENIGPSSRYVHMGMTSSDVLDTGFALQLREAMDILIDDVLALKEAIKDRAFEHKETLMIGRSHGIHAEPITFGLKLAVWYDEMARNETRLRQAREVINYGMVSGAVGTFANIPPKVEELVCQELRLTPAPASTQILQRDRHAQYFTTLAIVAGTLEKMSVEIRHLQRTEVMEAEEPFSQGQKGSSAMPHKRNPIGSENISGLSRLIRSYAMAALENEALWHERDISHSSVERVIGPDSTILLDYMLNRITGLIKRLVVYPDRMRENLDRTKGLFFSQQVLLALIDKGCIREDAYALVQAKAMKSWETQADFKELLAADPDITRFLNREELDHLFDLAYHLKHVDTVFKRVFGQ
ncbi:MAG: adenylosuccinate lyase [Deltaproteobacteria bacterium]|nr:adenylosuccinate lyase [Deltaproteobacteria bacterium]